MPQKKCPREGPPTTGRRFASRGDQGALFSGNFDMGAEDDLAVGAFDEGLSGLLEVGLVHAIYGSAGGLTGSGSQLLNEKTAIQYDLYGYSLNGEEDISH